MGFEILFELRENYFLLQTAGKVTEENLLDLGVKIKQFCDEVGMHNVIIDCAKMEGALSLGSLYFTVQKFVEIVGSSIKVAYINIPPSWMPEDDATSRRVAKSRGGSLEVFETEEEAARWLQT